MRRNWKLVFAELVPVELFAGFRAYKTQTDYSDLLQAVRGTVFWLAELGSSGVTTSLLSPEQLEQQEETLRFAEAEALSNGLRQQGITLPTPRYRDRTISCW